MSAVVDRVPWYNVNLYMYRGTYCNLVQRTCTEVRTVTCGDWALRDSVSDDGQTALPLDDLRAGHVTLAMLESKHTV